MNITVTLQLDEKLVDSAQNYAVQQGQSLSQLLENHLTTLVTQSTKLNTTKPSPIPTTGQNLLRFAGCIGSSDLALMTQAIAEECEKVDMNEW